MVAILSLTAPIVIIHSATVYVDLFSGALLAIGVTSAVAMTLFDRWRDRSLLSLGAGRIGRGRLVQVASHSCGGDGSGVLRGYLFTAIPASGGAAVADACFGGRVDLLTSLSKNLIVYHNPVWPVQTPVLSSHFPYTYDTRSIHFDSVPPPLADRSQTSLFLHSVLEIGHPTEYAWRERWTLDQGNSWLAYRSGGFWNVAVRQLLSWRRCCWHSWYA